MLVKIKTWENMKREYGEDGYEIKCEYGFTKIMEELLPKDRIINIDTSSQPYKWKNYSISGSMIETKTFKGHAVP